MGVELALVGRLRDALGSRSGAGLLGRVAGKVREELRDRQPAPSPATAPAAPVRPAPAPVAAAPHVAPIAQPAPAASKPSGLAAAARAAAASGVSSAATFRAPQEAPAEEEEHAAAPAEAPLSTRDVVIGEQQHDAIVRVAEDGARYHGPTDNDSARAKAEGKRLDIDRDECIGCGTCVEHIDTVFWLNGDEGKAYVLAQDGAMAHIQDAIDACPVTCISWQEA